MALVRNIWGICLSETATYGILAVYVWRRAGWSRHSCPLSWLMLRTNDAGVRRNAVLWVNEGAFAPRASGRRRFRSRLFGKQGIRTDPERAGRARIVLLRGLRALSVLHDVGDEVTSPARYAVLES